MRASPNAFINSHVANDSTTKDLRAHEGGDTGRRLLRLQAAGLDVVERRQQDTGHARAGHTHQRTKTNKVKVGHGGTLDPNARGCLVIGVGTGCRLMQSYLKGGKEYFAIGKLGEATDTLDSEGNVTSLILTLLWKGWRLLPAIHGRDPPNTTDVLGAAQGRQAPV